MPAAVQTLVPIAVTCASWTLTLAFIVPGVKAAASLITGSALLTAALASPALPVVVGTLVVGALTVISVVLIKKLIQRIQGMPQRKAELYTRLGVVQGTTFKDILRDFLRCVEALKRSPISASDYRCAMEELCNDFSELWLLRISLGSDKGAGFVREKFSRKIVLFVTFIAHA